MRLIGGGAQLVCSAGRSVLQEYRGWRMQDIEVDGIRVEMEIGELERQK